MHAAPQDNTNTQSALHRIQLLLTELLQSAYSQKRLLTVDEACAYLGIGKTEGYAQLRRHVKFIKHGRKILIPREELDHLIERAKRTGVLFD
jgi:excisionase family DNA binding protein